MRFPPDLHKRFVEQAAWTRQAQVLFLQSAGLTEKSRVLEVGCGTGALLSSLASINPALYTGVDIQFDLLETAKENSNNFPLSCADGFYLPFPDDCFDTVVCHYFLLWIQNVSGMIKEMRRVTRPGGIIGALAEPDYGSRIDYPDEFSEIGRTQREALIHQGAEPDMGRKLASALARAGCERISQGILGSYQPQPPSDEQIESEQNLLKADLSTNMDTEPMQSLLQREKLEMAENTRVQFIPTFFCWGYNPEK
jgi:SAM-dependent methyltransferase